MTFPRYFFIFVFIVFSYAFALEKTTLPSSTIVVVKSASKLSSKHLKTGQEITLIVAIDVNVKGVKVIAAGSPVTCLVENAEKAGMVGQAGRLTIAIQGTTAVDGTPVALTGNFNMKGESKTGESVAVGVILCPLALLCKGEEGDIPAGAQSRALTMGETQITVATDSGEMPSAETPSDSTIQNEKQPVQINESEFSTEIKKGNSEMLFGGKVSLSFDNSDSSGTILKAKGIWGFSEKIAGPFDGASIKIIKDHPVYMQIDDKTIYKIDAVQESSDSISLQFTKQ
jgi:hypothetical protein